ncbi:MAG: diacylglycerol kinase family lipid kinase [Defluviitaleaceae bacterium]|nr:diacylglycerol kinase family lipid kinase [Defluviitaleaceae bacterium]
MEKILLIINPVAGRRKGRYLMPRIIDFLCRQGNMITVFTTSRPGEAIAFAAAHSAEHHRIICCGGDGTLNEVFTGLLQAGLAIPIGYIPTGTSNDLARSLGLGGNTGQTISTALQGIEQPLDIGLFCGQKYFSYVASFGAFTKASYETPQWLKNHMGRASYFFYGISELSDMRPITAEISVDGTSIGGEFLFGCVSNSTIVGGLHLFAKEDVAIDDGKFEVLLVKKPKDIKDIQSIFNGILLQKYDDEAIIFTKAKEVNFSFHKAIPWTVDGEYAGKNDVVDIQNLARRVVVLR